MTTRQMLRPLKSPTFSKTKHDILSQKQDTVSCEFCKNGGWLSLEEVEDRIVYETSAFFHRKPGTKSSHVNFDSPAKQWKKDFFIECAHNHICYRQFMLVVEWSVGQGPNFIHLVSFMLADQTTVLYMSGKNVKNM